MDSIIEVSCLGEKVGVVVWDHNNNLAVFEFYESYARNGIDISPLIMPLENVYRGDRIYSFPENRGKTFKGLPGLLADSLPDDYGISIIDSYFQSKGLSSMDITPVDQLCYIGPRGMGALEFHPAWEDESLMSSSNIDLEQLTSLAQRILNDRKSFSLHLKQNDPSVVDLLKVGSSAGGAKPKAIIAWNEESNEIRSGQVIAPESFSYWLLKFDGVEDKRLKDNPLGVGRIEYAYHRMAVDCGIEMAECRLLHDGPYAHFLTKRFDRSDRGGRVHVQTLCAMAHFDRDLRFSYEQAFQVMRKLHLSAGEMDQFFRRMVFNVMARNHDDHTKNHAFLIDRTGRWALAPAYDLCYAYTPSGRWTNQHQMSINGKRDSFSRSDLNRVAENMGISSAGEIIEQILEVVSHWSFYAQEVGVKKEHSQEIQRNLLTDL